MEKGARMLHHGLAMKREKMSLCSDVWHEIFLNTSNPTPFLSYEWFLVLCTHLLKTDPEIMIFYKDNQPVGIFPGTIENDTLRFHGDERVTDFTDILFLPDYGEQIVEELVSHIMTDNLHLNLFPLESNSFFIKHISKRISDIVTEHADLCPIVFLPESWGGYLDSLNGKSRHELRRKLRKAGDVEMRSIEPQHLEILFQLMGTSDRNKEEFLTQEMRDFFEALTKYFFKIHCLRLRATFFDSQPIGVLFSFQMHDRVYLFNSGFDPQFSSLSPGIVTIGLDIKSAIDEGIKYYDFLRGDEDYKFRLGARKRYTMRIKR